MRVADTPAGEEHLAHVGFAVTVGIFQKESIGRLQNDHPAVMAEQTGGNIQSLGKDLERIGFAIVIGVFDDRYAILALAVAPL